MALNDVKFQTVQGLGALDIGEDSTSAIYFNGIAKPSQVTNNILTVYDAKSSTLTEYGIVQSNPQYAIVHYYISEYFRLSPGTKLYVIFSNYNISQLADAIATECDGEPRQVGVLYSSAMTDGAPEISDLNDVAQQLNDSLYCYHVAFVASYIDLDMNAMQVPSSINYIYPNVSLLNVGSSKGVGAAIANGLGYSVIPSLGAVLGLISKARVHESIAWPEKFNVSNGTENDKFLVDSVHSVVNNGIITALHDVGILVFRKHIGLQGTYLSDSRTLIDEGNDYAYIERNRTMGKAKRLLRKVLLPKLSAPLYVDDNGNLDIGTINQFQGDCTRALNVMAAAGEISGFNVYINPNQSVNTTSTLNIEVTIIPVGVARNIVVEIGYALKLA